MNKQDYVVKSNETEVLVEVNTPEKNNKVLAAYADILKGGKNDD